MKDFFNKNNKNEKNQENKKEQKNKDLLGDFGFKGQNFKNFSGGGFNNNNKFNKTVTIKKSRLIFIFLVLVLVFSGLGAFLGKYLDYFFNGQNLSAPLTINVKKEDFEMGEAVSLKASPTIVGIQSVFKNTALNQEKSAGEFDLPWSFPWQFDDAEDEESTKLIGGGSGVIWQVEDDFAYIVTNFHVVKKALKNGDNSEIEIYFGKDVKKYKSANVVDYDPYLDIAVLKVPLQGKKVSCVELGDSNKLNPAQSVFVIGSPSGISYNGSITHGIISGLKRSIKLEGIKEELETFQIDAPMNPGNSGGGIFDKQGKLIGICIAKLGGMGSSREGMGFCLPINAVKVSVEKIIKGSNGKVIKKMPNLGIIMESDILLSNGSKIIDGVFVRWVIPGSVAYNAKISPGDVIVEFDGEKIKDSNDLDAALSRKRDKTATITILRRSKKTGKYGKTTVKVTFDN